MQNDNHSTKIIDIYISYLTDLECWNFDIMIALLLGKDYENFRVKEVDALKINFERDGFRYSDEKIEEYKKFFKEYDKIISLV